jgi:hypothetical protein
MEIPFPDGFPLRGDMKFQSSKVPKFKIQELGIDRMPVEG